MPDDDLSRSRAPSWSEKVASKGALDVDVEDGKNDVGVIEAKSPRPRLFAFAPRDSRGARSSAIPNDDRHTLETRSKYYLDDLLARCERELSNATASATQASADATMNADALARALVASDFERQRITAMMTLVNEILSSRDRWETTKYERKIAAIPRDATRLIDSYNFQRFVHRGIDVEEMDERAIETLFDGCLRGLRSDSLTREKLLPVEELLRLVRGGAWTRLWDQYSMEASYEALSRGISGPSMALYSIASVDPLGADEFEGIPSSRALLNGPGRYVTILFQLLTLPVIAPFSAFSSSVRWLLHGTRFMFSSERFRQLPSSMSFVALVVYYAPYWALGCSVIFLYFTTSISVSITADGVVPAATAFALTSFVAMALSVSDVRSYDKLSAVTLFFPGGKTQLPDADSIVVQEHPTVDTLRAREVPRDLRTQSGKERGGNEAVDVSQTKTDISMDNEDTKAAKVESRRAGRGKSDGERPRWLSEMDDFTENVERKVSTVRRSSSNVSAGLSKSASRSDTAGSMRDGIEEIVASNKRLQLRSVTEKEILTALRTRSQEESRKTYWFRKNTAISQKFIFAVISLLIAALPIVLRLAKGHSIFGRMHRSSYCVDPSRAAHLPPYLDFSSCASTEAELINVVTQSISPIDGLSDGIVVILAFVWSACTTYALLSISRWMCSCAYHALLHWLLFSSMTDPTIAASYDVPVINLCHSWLPWVRIRMVVEDHRELEQMWVMSFVTHMLVLITGIVVVCLSSVFKLYFLSDITEIKSSTYSPVYPLVVATVLMIPTIVVVSIASKIYEIQENDVQQLQEARWKLFLDNCTIQSAGMEKEKAAIVRRNNQSIHALSELEHIVSKRNDRSWPKLFGNRLGAGWRTVLWAYAFFAAALTSMAIAIDVFTNTSKSGSAVASSIRDVVRLGFAYESVP